MTAAINTAVSGLVAQQTRLRVSAQNMVNASSTFAKEGSEITPQVYEPVVAVLSARLPDGGVSVTISPSGQAASEAYDPGHPGANKQGVVSVPSVNVVREQATQIDALNQYRANVAVIQAKEKTLGSLLDVFS